MEQRYIKNVGSFITEQDQEKLFNKTVCVLGCGGNGEYILNYLIRLGLKKIIIFDGDIFEESNFNRQFLYKEGQSKVIETAKYLISLNTKTKIEYYNHNFSDNDLNIIKNCDIIIHCIDNYINLIDTIRKIINLNIPYLFSGNSPEGGLVTIFTKDTIEQFDNFCMKSFWKAESKFSQPAYLCGFTAALACSEAVKYLTGKQCAINCWIDIKI